MAKRSQLTQAKVANQKGLAHVQHSEHYDDSLLPDAEELMKLKDLHPEMIKWIMERTVKEQDHRHQFDNRKLKLLEGEQRKAFSLGIISATFAKIIILCGMVFSAFLVFYKLPVHGSIFGGITILLAANSFLKFGKKNPS